VGASGADGEDGDTVSPGTGQAGTSGASAANASGDAILIESGNVSLVNDTCRGTARLEGQDGAAASAARTWTTEPTR